MPSNQETPLETKFKLFGEISARWFILNPGNPFFHSLDFRTAFNVVQAAGVKAPEELIFPGQGYFQIEAAAWRAAATAHAWNLVKAIVGLVETGGTITTAGIAAHEFTTTLAADKCKQGTYKSANSTASPKAKVKSAQRYEFGVIVQPTDSVSATGTIQEYVLKVRPVASFAA